MMSILDEKPLKQIMFLDSLPRQAGRHGVSLTSVTQWWLTGGMNSLRFIIIDLFRCDKSLLAAYLEAYNLGQAARQQLPHKAMILTLLHRFNVLEGVFKVYPEVANLATLADLASLLWDIDA